MNFCIRLAAVGTIVSLALSGLPARAQDTTARQEASARFKAGLANVSQGKWEKARLSFLQAYAVLPDVDILWNLALAELESNHPMDALLHLDAYEIDPKAAPKNVAALPMFRERAYGNIGRLKIEVPADATVRVDGVLQARSGFMNVLPGEHVVKMEIGHQFEERHLRVAAGQIEVVSWKIDHPTNVASSPANGTPGSGSHAVQPPPPVDMNARAGSSPSKSSALGWIGVAATTSAIAIGVGFIVAAKGKEREAEADVAEGGGSRACAATPSTGLCGDASEATRKLNMYGAIGSIGLVAGGVLGLSTAGYFLFKPHSHGLSVSPYAGGRQNGVVLRGRF